MPDPTQEELDAEKKKNDDLQARLGEFLEKDEKSAELLAQLTSNPEIRAILDAQEKGEKVSVVIGEGKKPSDGPDELTIDQLNDMENADLVKHLLTKIPEAMSEKVSVLIEPLKESLTGLQRRIGQDDELALAREIEAAQKKFPDWDKYKTEIVEISAENPSLPPEELYYLARIRKGDGLPVKTDSERPTLGGITRPERPTRKEPLSPGVKGFEQSLDEALEGEEPDLVRRR